MVMKTIRDREIMSRGTNDDEEDLEALRLAALESLRAKGLPPPFPLSNVAGKMSPSNIQVISQPPIKQVSF